MTTFNTQPGWYDDPEDSHAQRYWDGENWTPNRQRKPISQPVPPSPPPPALPPPPPPTGSPLPPPASSFAARGTGAGDNGLSAESLAAARGALGKLSATAWLIAVGLFAAAISVFLTWETVTENVSILGSAVYSQTGQAGTSAGGKFALLLPIAGAAWLAWPVFARTTITPTRLIGLSVVVGLLVLSIPVWFVAFRDNDPSSGTTSSYGFGLLLFAVAVIVVAAGVVRVWIQRASAAKLAQ